MITWLAVWGATAGAGIPAFWVFAVREPASAPVQPVGPVLAAVFLAVWLPASLLCTELARAVCRRVEYRRVRRLAARIVAGSP